MKQLFIFFFLFQESFKYLFLFFLHTFRRRQNNVLKRFNTWIVILYSQLREEYHYWMKSACSKWGEDYTVSRKIELRRFLWKNRDVLRKSSFGFRTRARALAIPATWARIVLPAIFKVWKHPEPGCVAQFTRGTWYMTLPERGYSVGHSKWFQWHRWK